MIDSRAIIDPSAKIADNVSIGPWSIIGPNVEIAQGTIIGSHVIVKANSKIGQNNNIHSFCSIGDDPQDINFKGQETWLEIGDNNVFREFCTLHRGNTSDNKTTKIGSHSFFMAYTHVAHDCVVADHVIFANNATLAGHVTVGEYANLGGGTMVHQFCRLGAYSFYGGYSGVMQDILPYLLVKGDPARPRSVNVVGLKRRGFSDEAIENIRMAYRILFRKGNKLKDARDELATMVAKCSEIQRMVDAIDLSERGIARPSSASEE